MAELTDVHVAANLMKIWLRSLPEPLVPFQLYQAAVDAGASNDPSGALQVMLRRMEEGSEGGTRNAMEIIEEQDGDAET